MFFPAKVSFISSPFRRSLLAPSFPPGLRIFARVVLVTLSPLHPESTFPLDRMLDYPIHGGRSSGVLGLELACWGVDLRGGELTRRFEEKGMSFTLAFSDQCTSAPPSIAQDPAPRSHRFPPSYTAGNLPHRPAKGYLPAIIVATYRRRPGFLSSSDVEGLVDI